ncbi:MAG: radical SAM protein, partial [bacterium]
MKEQLQQRVSSVYGPVNSWRFGRSLGIDLICETSVCSFNCIYCQLGDIQIVTNERRLFVPTAQIIRDLDNVSWSEVDIITFSGSGEPTLATNLGEVARHLKRYGKPLMVLTNSTHFHNPEVRRDLAELDIVDAKLDAASDEMLQRYNRPAPGHTIRSIVEGIQLLRKEFRGRLSLQI